MKKHGYLNGVEFYGIDQEELKRAEKIISETHQEGKHTYRECFYECFHETQSNYMKYVKSPQTLADIENCNRIFVLADELPYDTIADLYVEDITACQVKQLKRDIEKHNQKVKRPKKIKTKGELSHKRLNNIFCWIDLILKFAYDKGYVNKELLNNIKLTSFKGASETNKYVKRNFLTVNEFNEFIQSFDINSSYIFSMNYKKLKQKQGIDQSEYVIFKCLLYKAFFYMAFYTGLRKSELRGLRWCDLLDPDITGLFSVRVEKQYSDKCTSYVNKTDYTREPKTKSGVRRCYLNVNCSKKLQELSLFLISRNIYTDNEYIFNDFFIKNAKPIPATNIDRHFEKILKKTDIIDNSIAFNGSKRKITIHGMRHAACTLLLEKGMPIAEVARFLGHKNTQMVERVYREFVSVDALSEERIREGAKYFN